MSAYDPERFRASQPGGCRETLLIIRVAFEILLPVLGALVALVALVVSAFVLLAVHPLLALLPLVPVGAAIAWVVRRDRRLQEERERELRGG